MNIALIFKWNFLNIGLCSAGQTVDQQSKTCIDCPIGYYQPDIEPIDVNCTKCDVGFTTRNISSTNVSQCESRFFV